MYCTSSYVIIMCNIHTVDPQSTEVNST